MRKHITITTEKRIENLKWSDDWDAVEYGLALEALLTEIKRWHGEGNVGLSVKYLKDNFDVLLDNTAQVKSNFLVHVLNGMSINFSKYFNYSPTLGLNCATIYDFNGLVKAVCESVEI